MPNDYSAALTVSVTWDRFHRDTHRLAGKLAGLGPFKGILAVARGGLVPACLIARITGLRLVDTVCIASYDDRAQGSVTILKDIALPDQGAGWLVVDDLVDSGVTARFVKALLPKAHYATVYAKPMGRPDADTCAVEVEQEVWLVFPWDTDPT
ncbi:MAG: xanthine phosphoribosyltransferase [Rhodospirillales bacterium]|nr:xanthine phosphoribosyltransferase [Rhodospirillales bacterium]